MMNDGEAQRENELRDVEIEELRRRGLWQPEKRPEPKSSHVYRPHYPTEKEKEQGE